MAAATKLEPSHHTFLQAVMRRGPLSEKAAMAIYKSLVLSTGEGFVQFLLAINKELEFVQMEVKKVMNQYDGKEFYGLINTLPSKEAKLGTQFTQAQIVFFKALMEVIVQDPTASGVISSITAMNLPLEPQQGESQDETTQAGPVKLSMQARQEALALLEAEQLLTRTADGGWALGVKAFLELRSVFRNLEVPFCEVCNEAAIKAQLCSTRDCPKRIHAYCLARGSQSRNQRPKCPGCKTEWAQPHQNGGPGDEEPAEDEEYTEAIATQEPVQVSRRARTSRRRRGGPIVDDEEEENVEAEQLEENGDDSVARPSRSTRSSRSGR
ncbi:unnamed protein product [Calypogeia fissa]